jgi:DNA polymerase-1
MFTASPGNVLVIGDYSQAELRVLACYSNEPFLLDVYAHGRDLHTEVALKMFGEVFTKADRAKCKMFNFSYVYGGTEYSFAEDAGLPIEIAHQFVQDYNRMMPTALAWKRKQFETMRKEGEVSTVFGRKRRFPLIVESILGDVRKASTHMVISSTASDLDLISALELHNEGIPIVLLVHDSIIAEVPIAQGRDVGLRMFAKMQEVGNRYFPQVPWVADVEVRDRWCGGDYEAYNGPEEGWVFHSGEKENDTMADLSVHV